MKGDCQWRPSLPARLHDGDGGLETQWEGTEVHLTTPRVTPVFPYYTLPKPYLYFYFSSHFY